MTMNRNILYIVIGVLAVATVVFGYQLYQERQKTTGIEINVGKSGISIERSFASGAVSRARRRGVA
jgi:hypothetical protein